jgi:putative transposase
MISLAERQQVVTMLTEAMLAGARQKPACALLGLSVRTVQRWQEADVVSSDQRLCRAFAPANKLSEAEQSQILAVANSTEFGHLPPSQIVPRLADRGEYLASESTFYRVLRAHHQMAHRRADRSAQQRSKPRALSARAPNQLYSWDITYLPTRTLGAFFYLYLFMDIFSRKIVGWQVYEEESGVLAGDLLRDICRRENIPPQQVVLHSDNGSPMKGATMQATLKALGVVPSYSRPAVSNDNP